MEYVDSPDADAPLKAAGDSDAQTVNWLSGTSWWSADQVTKMLRPSFSGRRCGEFALNGRRAAILTCALALLGACEQSKRDDLSWAQGALERNPQLQVLSVDREARSFTVRLKDTGELRIVQAEEVVGSLPAAAAPAVAAAPAGTPAPAAPSAAPAPATADAEGPSGAPERESAATATPRSAGPGVIASGPGYSIKAARTDAAANARTGGFAQADSVARGLAVERRDEPIVCQGARFLRIDSRNLEFAGDAINAEDGCEIHITNSRIAAKGVGVSARAASVHIENSSIEGQSGAILASEGAQVYAEASRFRGLRRGLTPESWHDLGGNVWN